MKIVSWKDESGESLFFATCGNCKTRCTAGARTPTAAVTQARMRNWGLVTDSEDESYQELVCPTCMPTLTGFDPAEVKLAEWR